MDAVIRAAARALATGRALDALNLVARRDEAPALALRGIAMAQLGDFGRARTLLRAASKAFGSHEPVARARCVVAEAELALASRELSYPLGKLRDARATLDAHGDRHNAAHARYLEIRRLVLIGRFPQAEALLAAARPGELPAVLRAIHELMIAGIAIRRGHARTAESALVRSAAAARESGIAALGAEVHQAAAMLTQPAARRLSAGNSLLLTLGDVESLRESKTLVIDACRFAVQSPGKFIPLHRRPVLFTLAQALSEAWPGDLSRDTLVSRAFRRQRADESLRARLRVEIGRLRRVLRGVADIRATASGFRLAPMAMREVVVIARPIDDEHAAILALLADGEAWSTSALALALGRSQRSVQRGLEALSAGGKVQAFGQARARRWLMPPLPGITTALLLPAPLAGD